MRKTKRDNKPRFWTWRAVAFCLGALLGFLVRQEMNTEEGLLSKFVWAGIAFFVFCFFVLMGRMRPAVPRNDEGQSTRPSQIPDMADAPNTGNPGVDVSDAASTTSWDTEIDDPSELGLGSRVSDMVDYEQIPLFAFERRRIRITKVLGAGTGNSGFTIVGHEENPPEVGKVYRILTERGTIFRTSPVIQIAPGFIQTQNAVYKIEAID